MLRERIPEEVKVELSVKTVLDKLVEKGKRSGAFSESDLSQFDGSYKRWYTWLKEFFSEENNEKKIKVLFKDFSIEEGERLVIARNIKVYSLCPHHILPISYCVTVGYISSNKVLGVSKLARLVELLAKKPLLQEEFTKRIVKALMTWGYAKGAGAYAEGNHLCMMMRGVEQESTIITMEFAGKLAEDNSWKQEFLRFVR